MPYIITTMRAKTGALYDESRSGMPGALQTHTLPRESRRAVATLDEACTAVRLALTTVPRGFDLDAVSVGYCPRAASFGPQGGTIGPLPDGTVIEVEAVDYVQLRARIEMPFGDETEAEIIDAYNAREAGA